MKLLFLLFVSGMVCSALKAAADYTYENNGQTFVATVSGGETQFADAAYEVLNSNGISDFVVRGNSLLAFPKSCSYRGNVRLEQSVLLKCADALGVGPGTVTVAKGKYVVLQGAGISKNLAYDADAGWSQENGFRCYEGASTVNGSVTMPKDSNFTFYPYRKSSVRLTGGIAADYLWFRDAAGGSVEFSGSPLVLLHNVTVWGAQPTDSGYYFRLVFSVPCNQMTALGVASETKRRFSYSRLETNVDWAFDNPQQAMNFGPGSLWDLCGTEQRVGHLDVVSLDWRTVQPGPFSVITNSADDKAVLHVTQTADATPEVIFGGRLDVVFSGGKTTTINNAMTADGELSVGGGTLVFAPGGSWAAEKVVVADGATVRLSGGAAFPQSAEIALSGTGALAIDKGEGTTVVTQTVRYLSLDGVRQSPGCYAMGDGVLKVLYRDGLEFADSTLVVAAGEKLVLDENVFGQGSFDRIAIGAGGELDLASDIYFASDWCAFSISIAEAGVLNLSSGLGLFASEVVVGGRPVGPGRWDATNADWISGTGAVYIPRGTVNGTEVEWTAGGGDSMMSTAANWSVSPVDLESGEMLARFTAGASAVADGDYFLNGLSFETESKFTLSGASAGTALKLASGGIAVGGASPAVSAALSIEADQTWNLGNRAKTVFSGALNSDPLSRYSLHLQGVADFTGGGNFSGDIYGSTNLQIRGGGTFGSGEGTVRMPPKSTVVLQSVVLDKSIFVNNHDSQYGGHNLSVWGTGTSVVNGRLTFGNRNIDVNIYANSALELRGGVGDDQPSNAGYLYFHFWSGSHLLVAGRPIEVNRALYIKTYDGNFDASGFCGRMVFSVPGNRMSYFGYDTGNSDGNYRFRRCHLATTADWVFDNPAMLMMTGENGVWDLCGTQQRIGSLDTKILSGTPTLITNSVPGEARLSVTQTKDHTLGAVFGGKLSVDFSGACTTTIDNKMTAVGVLSVSEGVLAFTSAGSWRDASCVRVAPGAKLSLSSASNLGAETQLELGDGDSLEIASGVRVNVGFLVVAGVKQSNGRYRFGSGELVVGPQGFVLLVR